MICVIRGGQMYRPFGAVALLSLAIALPVQDAAAQDPIGGAILGGVGIILVRQNCHKCAFWDELSQKPKF
jgi:hypothetical protein